MILIGFVIDTWVWVEYYLGEDPRVSEYIENESIDLFTSTITLTELIKVPSPERGESGEISARLYPRLESGVLSSRFLSP